MKIRTKQKLLSISLAFASVFSVCAETTFTYTVDNGGATITGAKNIGTYLDIPESVDGYPVVAIGQRAFNFNLDLEYVKIPSGVTNICKYAFSLCHGMRELVIPDSVKTIEEYAFFKCYDVERIEIGSGVRTIERWAFGECYALEELHIKHGVEELHEYAFGTCYVLESVTLPSRVRSVRWGAFANIPALQVVYLPMSLKNIISDGTFENSPRVTVQYYNCKTPVAPESVFNVTATDDLNGKIHVTWEINEETEVSSFQIYRAMRPHLKKANLVAEVQAGEDLVYEDTDVSSDYTYCYWVKPINDIFKGSYSDVAIGYCEDLREELTFYVDAANGNDENTGLTKETAFKTLQKAIDRAGNCDTIVVADGVYASIETHNRRIVIESENGYKNAVIDGGGANVCAWLGGVEADSDDDPPPYSLDNWSGNKTILRGFTLCNGRGSCGAGAVGGTLENCLIISNVVEACPHPASPSGFGGGAYNSILRNCTLTGNSSLPTFDDDDCKWGGIGGGTWGCKLYGCIEWDNYDAAKDSVSYNYDMSFKSEYDENCCLEDPFFVDVANGDYRLKSSSPCVLNDVVIAGCETEVVSSIVSELSEAQVAAWISEDLAVRYANSDEGVAGYQSRFESKFGSDPLSTMSKPTGKKDAQGNDMYVWQDYIAGTDPTDTNSVFTATIKMADGVPVVEWSPKLSAAEESKRIYTVYGKASLESGEDWHSPTNSLDRFFTVGVEMK